MLAEQNGNCALCGKTLDGEWRRPSVDHDHSKTGRESVRGILHGRCNLLLGFCDDNIAMFQSAIDYLKKHR
jgi:hypothetical protein